MYYSITGSAKFYRFSLGCSAAAPVKGRANDSSKPVTAARWREGRACKLGAEERKTSMFVEREGAVRGGAH